MNNCLHISGNQYPSLDKVNFTKNIWKELASGFDEYHIIGRSYYNKFENFQEGNIYLHLVPALGKRERSFLASSFYIFHLIKKYKITHMLAQSSILGGFSAALASKLYKIPFMVEIHGEHYFRYLSGENFKNKFWGYISRFSFKSAQKVRSLNSFMTKRLQKQCIKNIVEIPNRVDLKIFNKQKQHFEISTQVKLISVGRFVREKNYLKLIQFLNESHLDFHLTLIGGGPLQSDYETYIIQSNISHKIRFINWIKQEDMINLIINSDIYIQYSVSEGMPRTIVEAMALRMPIISTNIGSIPGVLNDGVNAKLIRPNEIEELANAIIRLVEDENLRVKIGNQAYQDATEKYEWNNVFTKYRNELLNMKYQ